MVLRAARLVSHRKACGSDTNESKPFLLVWHTNCPRTGVVVIVEVWEVVGVDVLVVVGEVDVVRVVVLVVVPVVVVVHDVVMVEVADEVPVVVPVVVVGLVVGLCVPVDVGLVVPDDVIVVVPEDVSVDVPVLVWLNVAVVVGDVLVVAVVVSVVVSVVRSHLLNPPAPYALIAALTIPTLLVHAVSSLTKPSTLEHTIDVSCTAPNVNSFSMDANPPSMTPPSATLVACSTEWVVLALKHFSSVVLVLPAHALSISLSMSTWFAQTPAPSTATYTSVLCL